MDDSRSRVKSWRLLAKADGKLSSRLADLSQELVPAARMRRVLCLAGAGGQQGPVLAAAGAKVTVLDNSHDSWIRIVWLLSLKTLISSPFRGTCVISAGFRSGASIRGPSCSNCFIPMSTTSGARSFASCNLMAFHAGCVNPAAYIFDEAASERGELVVRHALPLF